MIEMTTSEENQDTRSPKACDNLTPSQQERLRTAMKILIDYLCNEGSRPESQRLTKMQGKRSQAEVDTESTLPNSDSI